MIIQIQTTGQLQAEALATGKVQTLSVGRYCARLWAHEQTFVVNIVDAKTSGVISWHKFNRLEKARGMFNAHKRLLVALSNED